MDPLTFDQVRVFLAVVDRGSFSAAARQLRRAQSAVSYAIANLERQLRVPLFDRSQRRPMLTEAGRALLVDARRVAQDADGMIARALGLARGLEAELTLVVDAMYPLPRIVSALAEFRAEFPSVPPRLYVESLGSVPKLVIDGVCALGVTGWLPDGDHGLVGQALGSIKLVCVCAPTHPLAAMGAPIPTAVLRDHVQLVLTDRSPLTAGRDLFVLATQAWRLADLGAKHSMLLSGLGWGNMPKHIVEDDLAAGRLVQIRPAENTPRNSDGLFDLPITLVRRADRALGPATRWIADHLAGAPETPKAES